MCRPMGLLVAMGTQHAATIASWLAQKLKLNREACYTAGLLQNIGELALLRALQGWLDDGGVLPLTEN